MEGDRYSLLPGGVSFGKMLGLRPQFLGYISSESRWQQVDVIRIGKGLVQSSHSLTMCEGQDCQGQRFCIWRGRGYLHHRI